MFSKYILNSTRIAFSIRKKEMEAAYNVETKIVTICIVTKIERTETLQLKKTQLELRNMEMGELKGNKMQRTASWIIKL
jgi:uncharacterized surface anchored protein